jgi:hypothetical protein
MKHQERSRLRRALENEYVYRMPLLPHRLAGNHFNIMESEACDYLCNSLEVRQVVFDMANEIGAIVYDPDTGCWHGKDVKG